MTCTHKIVFIIWKTIYKHSISSFYAVLICCDLRHLMVQQTNRVVDILIYNQLHVPWYLCAKQSDNVHLEFRSFKKQLQCTGMLKRRKESGKHYMKCLCNLNFISFLPSINLIWPVYEPDYTRLRKVKCYGSCAQCPKPTSIWSQTRSKFPVHDIFLLSKSWPTISE